MNPCEIELPEYIEFIDEKTLAVKTSDWEVSHDHRITIEDVMNYYATDARNIMSGCRRLGTIGGDWRPIDNLAQEILHIFKEMNLEEVKKEAEKHGMELRE